MSYANMVQLRFCGLALLCLLQVAAVLADEYYPPQDEKEEYYPPKEEKKEEYYPPKEVKKEEYYPPKEEKKEEYYPPKEEKKEEYYSKKEEYGGCECTPSQAGTPGHCHLLLYCYSIPLVTKVIETHTLPSPLLPTNIHTHTHIYTGQKGEMGPPGVSGNNGMPGHEGKSGLMGLPGTKGETGNRGPSGPIGPQGEKGTQGIKMLSVNVSYIPHEHSFKFSMQHSCKLY